MAKHLQHKTAPDEIFIYQVLEKASERGVGKAGTAQREKSAGEFLSSETY